MGGGSGLGMAKAQRNESTSIRGPVCDWRRLRPVADGTGKADASPARVCLWAGDTEQGGVGVLDV